MGSAGWDLPWCLGCFPREAAALGQFPVGSGSVERTLHCWPRTGREGSPPLATPVPFSGGPASGRAQIAAQAHIITHGPSPIVLAAIGAPRLSDFNGSASRPMPLLLSGRGFRQDLERVGALALFAPLEGGAETRLTRRLRAAGYQAHLTSARGLGDPEAFLFQLHGVRPPHLGHHSVGRGAAVGEVHRAMPLLAPQLQADGPVLLWLLEGKVLSAAELTALIGLCRREPRLKIVVEMGGARALRWQPLEQLVVGV